MISAACRVIVDRKPLSGHVNMAIDAALLQAADEQPAGPVVRVYEWSEPTISLGYFQKSIETLTHPGLAGCPRVRRLTGGGAILHHHELTYSCVIPRTHPISTDPVRLYERMHRTISQVLAACGASTGFRAHLPVLASGQDSPTGSETEPFLCFQRSDPRVLAATDIRIDGRPKITGSAQRRRRGAILQHGSILLNASPLLPDLVGICNLFPVFDLSSFVATLPGRLATSIGSPQIRSEYTDRERYLAFESESTVERDGVHEASIDAGRSFRAVQEYCSSSGKHDLTGL